MTRVLIVAESPQSRSRLENLLDSREIEIAASVADLASLSDVLLDSGGDVLILETAAESIETLLDAFNGADIFTDVATILLVERLPSWAGEALRMGVRAVLESDAPADQVVAAVEAANAGLVVLAASQVSEVVLGPPGLSPSLPELAEPLTRREREVLQMLAGGLANKQIAARLNISEHTAKFHVASILGKLSAGSRTEAVAVGIRHGLVLL